MKKISAFEQAYCSYLLECEGGMAAPAAGDGGGASAPGGGIAIGDVIGHCDHDTPEHGYFGPGCFHMPFPVLPAMHRYGWTSSKKKSKKNSVNYKNPYAKGSTIVVDSEDSREKSAPSYEDSALLTFRALTNNKNPIYTDVLYLNEPMKMAWRVDKNGMLTIYKTLQSKKNPGKISICSMRLTPDDKWNDIGEYGEFDSRDDGFNVIRSTCNQHREKLNEMIISQFSDPAKKLVQEISQMQSKYRKYIKTPEIDDGTIYIDAQDQQNPIPEDVVDCIENEIISMGEKAGITCRVEYDFHRYGENGEAYKLNSFIIEMT